MFSSKTLFKNFLCVCDYKGTVERVIEWVTERRKEWGMWLKSKSVESLWRGGGSLSLLSLPFSSFLSLPLSNWSFTLISFLFPFSQIVMRKGKKRREEWRKWKNDDDECRSDQKRWSLDVEERQKEIRKRLDSCTACFKSMSLPDREEETLSNRQDPWSGLRFFFMNDRRSHEVRIERERREKGT